MDGNDKSWIRVGQRIARADGVPYTGVITSVDRVGDTVQHRCLETGKESELSYFGTYCRYRPV